MDWLDDHGLGPKPSSNATPGDKTVPSIKKPKKARYQPTPAQVIMRHEITSLVPLFDEEIGVADPGETEQEVSGLALDIINAGPTLELSLKQWHIVQGLVEHGLRAGIQVGRDAAR
jgi:hypothetical protein